MPRKPHRGDVREDGRIFHGMSADGYEVWLKPESFARQKQLMREQYLRSRKDPVAVAEKRQADLARSPRYKSQRDDYRRSEAGKQVRRNWEAKQKATNPLFRLRANARTRLRDVLVKRNKRSTEIIGCGWEALKTHLESLFRPGMSWANYGSMWHVDHIRPLASASSHDELVRLCHFSNLQPLFAVENMEKGARYVSA